MQHAEVIYETGDKSVVSIDSTMEDFYAGLREQHNRAKLGLDAGPVGGPASRIKKVYVYEAHPVDLHDANNLVSAETVTSLVSGMTNSDGQVNTNQLIEALRDELSPVYPLDQGRHESIFKAEGKELDLSFLDADTTGEPNA